MNITSIKEEIENIFLQLRKVTQYFFFFVRDVIIIFYLNHVQFNNSFSAVEFISMLDKTLPYVQSF